MFWLEFIVSGGMYTVSKHNVIKHIAVEFVNKSKYCYVDL